MKDKIASIIKMIKPYDDISDNTELVKDGILDSMAVMNLIVLLEDEFDIEIDLDSITAENFSNIQNIERTVLNCDKGQS